MPDRTFPHTPLFACERFRGKTRRGLYGNVIEEIDWSVGQILEELDRHDIADKHPEIVQRLLALCEEARRHLGDGKHEGAGVRPPGRL